MMPSNQSQPDISRNYVLKALRDEKKGTGYYPWFCFAAALGEYRSKNYKAAELHCKESLSNTRETHLHHNGLNNALLSLIYLKTDQKSKAIEAIGIAKDCYNGLKDNRNNNHDTILIQLLVKEYESAIL